jgi:hypothetical protein
VNLLKQIKTAALIWLALYLMLLPTNAEQGGLNAGELLQLYQDPKSKDYVAKIVQATGRGFSLANTAVARQVGSRNLAASAPWRRGFALFEPAVRSDRLEPSGFGSLVALRTAAPSECISRADRPQGALTEPVGIALTGFRKCDDALRKRRTKGGVPVGVGRSDASAISKAIPIRRTVSPSNL